MHTLANTCDTCVTGVKTGYKVVPHMFFLAIELAFTSTPSQCFSVLGKIGNEYEFSDVYVTE